MSPVSYYGPVVSPTARLVLVVVLLPGVTVLLDMDAGVPVVPGAAVPLETVVVVPAALPVGPVVLPIGGSAAVVPETAVVEEAGAAAEGAAEAADVDPPGPMVDSVLVLPEAPVPVVPGAAVPEEAAAEEVPVYFPVLSST